jgi:hypothetical protein
MALLISVGAVASVLAFLAAWQNREGWMIALLAVAAFTFWLAAVM